MKKLARRIGKSAAMTSKHLAILGTAGLAMTKYSRIYQLVPARMPAPGATHLDFDLSGRKAGAAPPAGG